MNRFTNTSPWKAVGSRVLPALMVHLASAGFAGCGDDASDASTGDDSRAAGRGGSGGRDSENGGGGRVAAGGGGRSPAAGGDGNPAAGGDGNPAAGDGGVAGGGGAADAVAAGSGGTGEAAGGAGQSGVAGQGGQDGDCSLGYASRGGECIDIDECRAPGAETCPDGRVCVNTEGSHECACAPGYSEVGGACATTCAPRDFDGANIALGLGHTDVIAAAYDEGSGDLRLFVSDDSFPIRQAQAVRRAPQNVLVHGKPTAVVEVPDIPALAGILEPGTNVWLLPEGQPEAEAGGLVWPGFQSYGVGAGQLLGDRVLVRLSSHEGPGRFVGFGTVQDETTPPDRYFDLRDAIDEFSLPWGTHFHMNWAFTEGGLHRLRFELGGTTAGGAVESEAHSYRFFFGELSELPESEPTVVAIEGLDESYAAGAELQLSAARHGMASTIPVSWGRQCTGTTGGEPGPWEPAGEGNELRASARRGCQYIACLVDGTRVVAISQAVLPNVQ
jgi:surface-anchored protein